MSWLAPDDMAGYSDCDQGAARLPTGCHSVSKFLCHRKACSEFDSDDKQASKPMSGKAKQSKARRETLDNPSTGRFSMKEHIVNKCCGSKRLLSIDCSSHCKQYSRHSLTLVSLVSNSWTHHCLDCCRHGQDGRRRSGMVFDRIVSSVPL